MPGVSGVFGAFGSPKSRGFSGIAGTVRGAGLFRVRRIHAAPP